jgi:hypothetical protein
MAKKSKSPFPQVLHVTQEKPANDEPFLMVQEGGIFSLDANEDGQKVAIYKLVEVKTLKITKELK